MADEHVGDRPADAVPLATVSSNGHAPNPEALHSGLTPRRSPTEAAPLTAERRAETTPGPKDNFREIVETVVFVVVLVLLLKSFVAEAFVIPTGSMAETLWGYQKIVECPQCHHEFPVNCSSEVEPAERERIVKVTGAICPNCRYDIDFDREGIAPHWHSGDRVLVSKYIYDTLVSPKRFEVVVFKFPREPQQHHVQMNYIKRLIGEPGETVAIYYGDLYATRDLKYENHTPPTDPEEQREREAMYEDDPAAKQLFMAQVENQFQPSADGSKFAIIRKGPKEILAMRRLVFDNDHQPNDLKDRPARWQPSGNDDAWEGDDRVQPRRFTHQGGSDTEFDWLRYRHLARASGQPELITDFMGYNTGHRYQLPQANWVPDLILECDVTVRQPRGEWALDLVKGVDRFQARWDLSTGVCTLVRRSRGREEVLATQPTDLKKKATYRVRFANVDERLTVWVDGALPFGDGVAYPPTRQRGPFDADLQPAGIGARGADVTVEHVQLWRDTYYTTARGGNPSGSDAESQDGRDWSVDSESWQDPSRWEPLRNLQVKTMYVQPDHFLCLGDNSPESSDGRSWGLVPRRLLLGRALLVYWPYHRAGPIR